MSYTPTMDYPPSGGIPPPVAGDVLTDHPNIASAVFCWQNFTGFLTGVAPRACNDLDAIRAWTAL